MDYKQMAKNRPLHCYGVAKKCYQIAKEKNMPEDFCRKMFTLGWNHDIGYEFSSNEHEKMSVSLLKLLGADEKELESIRLHGTPCKELSEELKILQMADMLIDGSGNEVTVEERLKDIATRHGIDSDDYKKSYEIAKIVNLI